MCYLKKIPPHMAVFSHREEGQELVHDLSLDHHVAGDKPSVQANTLYHTHS